MDGLSENEKRLYAAFLLICVLRLGSGMFSYVPYLDDYTQYFYYPSLNAAQGVLFGGAKTIYTRPLASLFDIYLWSRFGHCLFLARLALCLMYGLSGILFHFSLSRLGLKISPLFLVIYGFLPLGSEALFWISASSRIALSLFLISLWLFFFLRRKQALFIFFHFISYWFYEQTAALSFFLCIIFAVSRKNRTAAITSFVCAASFAAFYTLFGKMGINAARTETASVLDLPKTICAAAREVFYIFTSVQSNFYTRGITSGIKLLLSSPEWLFVFVYLSALWLFLSKAYENSTAESTARTDISQSVREKRVLVSFLKSNAFKKLALGALLFFVSYAPFYIQKTLWLNLRNTAPSFLGFALFFDAASDIAFALLKQLQRHGSKISDKIRLKSPRKNINLKTVIPIIKSTVFSVLLLIFLISGISEVSDYHKTAEFDKSVAFELCREYKKTGSTDLYLKVSLPEYLNQNAIYHDHITTSYQLDWGYSAAVRAITKNPKITVRTPLSQ